MTPAKLARLARAAGAAKQAEMARLGAAMAEAAAARREAQDLREKARTLPAPDTVAEMAAVAQWQRRLRSLAEQADHRAAGADKRATALKVTLARAIGRDGAINKLQEAATAQARKEAEARQEERSSASSAAPKGKVSAGSPGMA